MTINVPIVDRLKKNAEKRNANLYQMERRTPKPSVLRFTPTAWAKLLHLRDRGETEVGGFGISAPHDLLLIEDVRLIQQVCTAVSVKFDDASVADFFDQQVDLGRRPQECGRIWVHTHPGNSPFPSGIDEETFARCFGQSDWAVMFILAQGGQTYARLRFNVGPGGSVEIPVEVDFKTGFMPPDPDAWDREYTENIFVPDALSTLSRHVDLWGDDASLDAWHDYTGSNDDPFL